MWCTINRREMHDLTWGEEHWSLPEACLGPAACVSTCELSGPQPASSCSRIKSFIPGASLSEITTITHSELRGFFSRPPSNLIKNKIHFHCKGLYTHCSEVVTWPVNCRRLCSAFFIKWKDILQCNRHAASPCMSLLPIQTWVGLPTHSKARLWWKKAQHLLQDAKQAEWEAHAQKTQIPWWFSGKGF